MLKKTDKLMDLRFKKNKLLWISSILLGLFMFIMMLYAKKDFFFSIVLGLIFGLFLPIMHFFKYKVNESRFFSQESIDYMNSIGFNRVDRKFRGIYNGYLCEMHFENPDFKKAILIVVFYKAISENHYIELNRKYRNKSFQKAVNFWESNKVWFEVYYTIAPKAKSIIKYLDEIIDKIKDEKINTTANII